MQEYDLTLSGARAVPRMIFACTRSKRHLPTQPRLTALEAPFATPLSCRTIGFVYARDVWFVRPSPNLPASVDALTLQWSTGLQRKTIAPVVCVKSVPRRAT